MGNYESQHPRRLETMRNDSQTTVGMHEINSAASSKHANSSLHQQYNLQAVMSQKRIKLPSLTRNNIEISTNPSSMRKEKRSMSTIRGQQTHSRATLMTNDNVSSFGMPRDQSLGTIKPVVDGSNSKLQSNVSRLSTSRNTLAYKPDLTKIMGA